MSFISNIICYSNCLIFSCFIFLLFVILHILSTKLVIVVDYTEGEYKHSELNSTLWQRLKYTIFHLLFLIFSMNKWFMSLNSKEYVYLFHDINIFILCFLLGGMRSIRHCYLNSVTYTFSWDCVGLEDLPLRVLDSSARKEPKQGH